VENLGNGLFWDIFKATIFVFICEVWLKGKTRKIKPLLMQ
jgi:hypothetical protein